MLREEFKFLGENRILVLMIFFLFCFTGLMGFFFFPFFEKYFEDFLLTAFEGIFIEGSSFETFTNIFLRNVTATFITLLTGFFIVGPAAIVSLNGFLVGAVTRYSLTKGLELSIVFAGIIPHGIFELPAFFINAALAGRIGYSIIKPLKGRGRLESFKVTLLLCIRVYFFIVVPLLLIAAMIETYITSKLILG
ncbi:MAG: stage II sporulation protein M [Candidatus Altiarchaeota archaeon]